MSTTTGNNYFSKSMNSIIEIDDGAGTVISDGSIQCNSFNASTFSTNNLNSTIGNITTINANNIVSNYATINNLNSTTLNLATIYSNNIVSNYATINNINSTTLNLATINSNNIVSNYGTINNLNSTTVNLTTINSNNIVSNFATINKITSPTGNITTVNSTDLNTQYLTGLQATTQYVIVKKDLNNPNYQVSSYFSNDPTIYFYELVGATKMRIHINDIDALIIEQNTATFNNNIISPNASITTGNITNVNSNTIQPQILTNPVDICTSSSGNINIGGTGITTINASSTGKTFLSKNGNYSVETGINSNTAYIDFHSSNTTSDYDSRIITTGGSATSGQGIMELIATRVKLTGNIQFTNFLSSQTVGGKAINTTYQNTNTSPKFISVSATGSIPASWFYAKTDTSTTPTTIVAQSTIYNNVAHSIFFIVLPNYYYRVEVVGGGGISLLNWTEWG